MKEDNMWTEITFNNRDPLYLQVVRYFKVLIATGRLQAGQTIPSRRELGTQLKINPNTAQRAYKEMEDQLLIVTAGNSPSRITSEDRILQNIRTELLSDAVDALFASVHNIDVSLAELQHLVSSKYNHIREIDRDGKGED